ncbi:MAG: UMP kinase [Chlamydiales bacterium]
MDRYQRIIIKLSGEAFMGSQDHGLCHNALSQIAHQISKLQKYNCQVGVVIGAGNLFRGLQKSQELQIERIHSDEIGMLSTLINGIALKDALIKIGTKVHLITGLECPRIAESYQVDRVIEYLSMGEVVLFVGGIGHPYFTTDTNAALRACEIHADILFKATMHVDGVFDKNPSQHMNAKIYHQISFQEILKKELAIMDFSAITMCMQAKIPIRVFNFNKVSLTDALLDKSLGTLISG